MGGIYAALMVNTFSEEIKCEYFVSLLMISLKFFFLNKVQTMMGWNAMFCNGSLGSTMTHFLVSCYKI